MTPAWFHRVIDLGDEGDDVLIVQRKVDAPMSGKFDETTAARVRGAQKKKGLPQSGRVDEATAEAFGEKPGAGLLPEWYNHSVKAGDACGCVAQLRLLLRQPNLPTYYDRDLEDALRRFQSEAGLKVDGIAGRASVLALADRSFR